MARYLHIYYSYGKAASEREDLESKIDRIAAFLKKQEGQPVVIDKSYEKYFSLEYYHEGKEDQCFVCGIEKASVIEEELKMCGYFCIITSAEMSAKEALDLYKSRDASEKLFKADKSFLGNRSLRVYTGDSLEGKMLIAFVALIIRNRMYTKLKDAEEELLEKPNYMNVPASIRELEKIEMIRQADGVSSEYLIHVLYEDEDPDSILIKKTLDCVEGLHFMDTVTNLQLVESIENDIKKNWSFRLYQGAIGDAV